MLQSCYVILLNMQSIDDKILLSVQKPARYSGGELNSIKKDLSRVNLKIALSFPDQYEIGMSNIAIQILYYIMNKIEDVACERVFAPWPDMEDVLIKNNIPLFSLESRLPISQFDMLGFCLAYELSYTNLLNILKLSHIPLRNAERDESHPLIFGGGPCAFNPEPLAPFIDFFIIGEAEDAIVDVINKLKSKNVKFKKDKLEELSKIPGIYIPAIKQGKIKKRIVENLDSADYPTKPIVPLLNVIHDRATLEIMRGCPAGCKFCQAGYTTKPVRERSPELLKKYAEEIISNTGYEEISLISLSSSDYSHIDELSHDLLRKFKEKRVSIALPSLRSDSFSVKLARDIQEVRTSGVTLAPEAGTQRLRDYICKNLNEADILDAAKAAFEGGAHLIKLYFMIGLPTEKEEDLLGICDLSRRILQIGREFAPADRRKRIQIKASLSTFVPKPHTPFEREAMITIPEIIEKHQFIKNNMRERGVDVKWHDAQMSVLEGVFALGDEKLAVVLEEALKLGCKFDGWTEHFHWDLWLKAFENCGIDYANYIHRRKDADEILPWSFIDAKG